MRRPQGAGAVVVAVGTAAVLLLVLAVSASDRVWFLRSTGSESTDEAPPGLRQPPEGGTRSTELSAASDQLGTWFSVLSSIVVGLIAVVLLFLLFRQVSERRQRRRARGRTADVGSPFATVTSEPIETPPELLEAADRLSALLAVGSPRNAIVNCWVALEEACAKAGLPRHPAETSVEFTTRVLRTFALSGGAIDDLAGLYREARFSTHELTEQDRASAVDALVEVQSELRRPRVHAEELPS